MTRMPDPGSILGHTLVTLSGAGATATDIEPEGRLGEPRPAESDPAAFSWRGGPVR